MGRATAALGWLHTGCDGRGLECVHDWSRTASQSRTFASAPPRLALHASADHILPQRPAPRAARAVVRHDSCTSLSTPWACRT